MEIGSVGVRAAVREHEVLVRTLVGLGARTTFVPFVHGAYDSVFSKDNAVLVEREDGVTEALLTRPRYAVRRSEQEARAAAFGSLGIRVAARARAHLEGGDVVVLPRGRGAFLGHGFRSDERAAHELAAFLRHDVACVELRDPRLYHLDMALALLEDGTALVCEEALTEEGRRTVEAHPAVRAIVRVPLDEALRFGANLVQIGSAIVSAADAPMTTDALRARGYDVRRVRLEQFHRAGGSAACLVARIHHQGDAHDVAPCSSAA